MYTGWKWTLSSGFYQPTDTTPPPVEVGFDDLTYSTRFGQLCPRLVIRRIVLDDRAKHGSLE